MLLIDDFTFTVEAKSVIFNYLSISITNHITQLVSDIDIEIKQSTHEFVTNILNTLPQLIEALENSHQQNTDNVKNIIDNTAIIEQTQSKKSKIVKKCDTIISDNDSASNISNNDKKVAIKKPRSIICPISKLSAKSKKQIEYNMSVESISEFLTIFIIETLNYNNYITIDDVREEYVKWCNKNKNKHPFIAKNNIFEEILFRKNSLGLPTTFDNELIWRGYKWV